MRVSSFRRLIRFVLAAWSPKRILLWRRKWRTWPVSAWAMAAEHFKNGRFVEAAALYRRGLETHRHHPAYASALLDLAYCELRSGRMEAACRELCRLFQEGYESPNALLLLARIRIATGDPRRALAVLSRCLRQGPDNPLVLSAFLHVALSLKLSEEDISHLQQRLRVQKGRLNLEDPRNPVIDTALAEYEFAFGLESRADQILARVLATGNAPYEALLLRAQRFLDAGRSDQARDLLGRVIELAPYDYRAHLLLARSYLGDDQCPQSWAVQHAEAGARLSRWRHLESLDVLASAYELDGQASGALLSRALLRRVAAASQINFRGFKQIEDQLIRLRSNG